MVWLSKRLGKKGTVILSFAVISLGNLLKVVCYNRAFPRLTFLPTICLSLGMVICFSLVNSMISDICDEEEARVGTRQEGVYFAVYNWWWKMGVSIASVTGGYLLRWTGFLEGVGTQTASVMFWIRFWEIGLPTALCVAGIFLLASYPLTEESAYETKALLAERKEAAVALGGESV